jgi:hypothetical protein
MKHSLVPEGTKIGYLVFSDSCGEMLVLGYDKEKYFITFNDAASKTLLWKFSRIRKLRPCLQHS